MRGLRRDGVLTNHRLGERKSLNKHIPLTYLANDEATRLAVLAGLVDSDGSKDHGGYTVVFNNVQLARDTKYLADTLGFRTSLRAQLTRCNGVAFPSWKVRIGGDVWRIPCRIPRKQYAATDFRKNKDWRLSQVNVVAVGEGEWAGFTVDGDQLFLLEDGTVTHNSSTMGVLYAFYMGTCFPKRNGVLLSATGFRGGQMMFLDAERWLQGGWDSQHLEAGFFRDSIKRTPDPINKSQSFWEVVFASHSRLVTLPTKDPEAIRGHRGHDLYLDEANFLDKELIERVAKPFLNVGGDMRHGGAAAEENRVFYTTTIDYECRPFHDQVRAARDGLERDARARELMLTCQWKEYRKLDVQGLHEHTFTKFDYTDTLVRRRITTRDGRTMEVTWPDEEITPHFDPRGIPFTEREETEFGVRMSRRGKPLAYYRTYSIQKKTLERSLRDGSTDEASWKSEQRNIVDTATGDVYSHDLMEVASCAGPERAILTYEECPPAWQAKYQLTRLDYVPPVLWSCQDPCVLGVDYAPTSDFCAFIVIRLGPLAKGEFNPLTNEGKTKWSNVIWCEQHKKMTTKEAANKIRQLWTRYNLVYFHEPYLDDTWRWARAIGMDMKGGGSGIRDELARFDQKELGRGEYRIYDPLDKDERIAAFAKDATAFPMLDGIHANDQWNDRFVEYTKGQMENRLLFIPKWLDESQRVSAARELDVGYQAARILDRQLRKLRQEPTTQYRKFFMDGDTAKDRNKKDLVSAFWYASKQMRAHVLRQTQIENTPPPMAALKTRVNSRRGHLHGRAKGAKA
jgi:hypothetical protein